MSVAVNGVESLKQVTPRRSTGEIGLRVGEEHQPGRGIDLTERMGESNYADGDRSDEGAESEARLR